MNRLQLHVIAAYAAIKIYVLTRHCDGVYVTATQEKVKIALGRSIYTENEKITTEYYHKNIRSYFQSEKHFYLFSISHIPTLHCIISSTNISVCILKDKNSKKNP